MVLVLVIDFINLLDWTSVNDRLLIYYIQQSFTQCHKHVR